MIFEEALKAMREGKKVRRKVWCKGENIKIQDLKEGRIEYLRTSNVLAEDWETFEGKISYQSITYHDVDGYEVYFNSIANVLNCSLPITGGVDLSGRKIKVTIETVD